MCCFQSFSENFDWCVDRCEFSEGSYFVLKEFSDEFDFRWWECLCDEVWKFQIPFCVFVMDVVEGVQNANMEKDYNPGRAGTGGSDKPDLPAEFSKLPHDRGTIGAARSANPNSANSQFFINFNDNHFLNGQYTVYGRVISGMEHVDAITRGEPPANPDRMISVKVAADA